MLASAFRSTIPRGRLHPLRLPSDIAKRKQSPSNTAVCMRQLTLATGRSTWLPYGWADIALSLGYRVIYPDVICLSQSGLALNAPPLRTFDSPSQVQSPRLSSLGYVAIRSAAFSRSAWRNMLRIPSLFIGPDLLLRAVAFDLTRTRSTHCVRRSAEILSRRTRVRHRSMWWRRGVVDFQL